MKDTVQTPRDLLCFWLDRQLDGDAKAWFAAQADKLGKAHADRDLYMAVSLVPRKIGKDDLDLTAEDLDAADAVRPGWDPSGWSTDQAARLALMLTSTADGETFNRRLDQLCTTADVRELIVFFQGLPIYPEQTRYVDRAREGARTNMKAVFEAVAHRNPYAAENFDLNAWNQMVLKAIFVGSALAPIKGLDERRNEELATTLVDYAHERWAASRAITPELWRMVAPYVDETLIEDLKRPLASEVAAERHAAVLALRESGDATAVSLLEDHQDLLRDVEEGRISWETVSRDMENP